MALPASGAISLSAVNTELGSSSTAAITMNDAAVRSLFGKSSGAIAMSDGYGKSNVRTTLTEIGGVAPESGYTGLYAISHAINQDGKVFAACRVANSNGARSINIYTRTSTTWSLRDTIAAPSSDSNFGKCISMSYDGLWLCTTITAGHNLYYYNGSSWSLSQSFTGYGTAPIGANSRILMNGDATVIAAGDYQYNSLAGRTIVYKRANTSSSWDAGTYIYPSASAASNGWNPSGISGDGNYVFCCGQTNAYTKTDIFDSGFNRTTLDNVGANQALDVLTDYTASKMLWTHQWTTQGCEIWTRSGSNSWSKTQDLSANPTGYSATNGSLQYWFTGRGMSKDGQYLYLSNMNDKSYNGSTLSGAFVTYNYSSGTYVYQTGYKNPNTNAQIDYFGNIASLPLHVHGRMSADGSTLLVDYSGANGMSMRFFTYT
jgi:hypothetical protein